MSFAKIAAMDTVGIVAMLVLTLVPGTPVLAAPPDKEVIVVNPLAQPVPVTGTVEVSGGTTVSGTVNAVQSGPWTVSVAPGETLYYNPGFNVIGAGASLDFGPFDLADLGKLRVIARGFNNNGGALRFRVFAWGSDPVKRIFFDEFTLDEARTSRVYDAPPPSVLVNVLNGPGGAANYHLVVIGR